MAQSESDNPDAVPPLAGKVVRGTVFSIGLRLVVRLMGLVSLSVTARLLTPEDFGVVGTASLIIGLFLVLREVGTAEALIREKTLDIAFIRTMWTLRVFVAALITALLLAAAGPASLLLNEPRVEPVIHVLALVPLIESLASPANAYFVRTFQFGKDFATRSLHKLSMVIAAIAFAYTLGDYWALVYAQLIGAFAYTILSHSFMPLKPIPSLKGGKRLSIFAFWTFCRSLAMFFVNKGDEFVVRRQMDSAQFGIYHASRDLSRILVSEIIEASAGVFLSVISRLRDEGTRFVGAIQTMLAVAAIMSVAASTGLALVSDDVVLIILGPQWTDAGPILAILGFGVAAQAVSTLCLRVFTVLDRQHAGALLWAGRAVVLISACALSVAIIGVEAVPYAFSASSIALCIWEIGFTYYNIGAPVLSVVKLWVRPVLAAASMYLVVFALPLDTVPILISLAIEVASGGLVYGVTLLGLWRVAGRPHGGETAILARLPVPAKLRPFIMGPKTG